MTPGWKSPFPFIHPMADDWDVYRDRLASLTHLAHAYPVPMLGRRPEDL